MVNTINPYTPQYEDETLRDALCNIAMEMENLSPLAQLSLQMLMDHYEVEDDTVYNVENTEIYEDE